MAEIIFCGTDGGVPGQDKFHDLPGDTEIESAGADGPAERHVFFDRRQKSSRMRLSLLCRISLKGYVMRRVSRHHGERPGYLHSTN